jgi:hypothetical protein
VLVATGLRWETTGEGIEVEHLLAGCAADVLDQCALHAPEPAHGRPVLLACAPEEQHCLPLSALAAALAERGVGTRRLGARTPAVALVAAVRRTGPCAVVLWSQLASTADPAVLADLPATRPPTCLILGGPGWLSIALPPRATYADRLASAVQLVEAAAGPPG